MEKMNETRLVESVAPVSGLTGKKWRGLILAADRWGSSAYYPAEVLERDGVRAFPKGTHIYKNHQTKTEEYERPERNIEDLVGSISSDVVFGDEGEGLGLYADIDFHDSFISRVTEAHKDVGLSVNAHGLTEDDERDGRYGPVLQGILSVDSVDVVTKAGAGGKLIKIIESDRGPAGQEIKDTKVELTKEDIAGLTEAITALRESIAEQPAGAAVVELSDEDKALLEKAKAEKVAAEAEAAGKNEKPVEVVEVNHAELVEALAAADLPLKAVVIDPVVTAVKAGTPLKEAIKVQTDLRDALGTTSLEVGTVIRESYRGTEESGLARSVKILGN